MGNHHFQWHLLYPRDIGRQWATTRQPTTYDMIWLVPGRFKEDSRETGGTYEFVIAVSGEHSKSVVSLRPIMISESEELNLGLEDRVVLRSWRSSCRICLARRSVWRVDDQLDSSGSRCFGLDPFLVLLHVRKNGRPNSEPIECGGTERENGSVTLSGGVSKGSVAWRRPGPAASGILARPRRGHPLTFFICLVD